MVSIYDCTEPTIINEELLQKAVDDQRPEGEAGRIALRDGIKFSDVKTLQLSFKNILQIENMWNFTSLVRLNLDNNVIEKIEGLDALVNLKWLDLSFNNIDVINGLNNLVQLEDLSLYNNNVRFLQNLDSLKKLQVFSIGNNYLSDLETLLVLRKLKTLQTLNLTGCPICKDPAYKLYVAAFLSNVVYLDYHLIDEHTRTVSYDKYMTSIEALAAKDRTEQNRLHEKKMEDEKNKLYQTAGVSKFYSTTLFDSLLEGDHDVELCLTLEGGDKVLNTFRENFLSACKNAFDYGLDEFYKRQEEVDLFTSALRDAVKLNQNKAVKLVDDFLIRKEEVIYRVTSVVEQNLTNNEKKAELINKQQANITLLWDQLMENELFLADQIEDAMRDFDRILNEMMSATIDSIRSMATQMRDIESQFHEQLLDISILFMEKIIKEEEILLDHMKELFVDKETVMTALQGSHDIRVTKLDLTEDRTVSATKNWTNSTLENIQNNETQRNRRRVLEITHLIDCQRKDTEELDRMVKDTKSSDVE